MSLNKEELTDQSCTRHVETITENERSSSHSEITNPNKTPSDILINQILLHHRSLQPLEEKLKEVLQIQEECMSNLEKENSKFAEIKKQYKLTEMFEQVLHYNKKLNHLHNEMNSIQQRTAKLKQRAIFIQKHQEQKVQEKIEAQKRLEERERLLTAKPVWEVDHSVNVDKN